MKFSGSQMIAAPLEDTWNYLQDVRNVAKCVPGFEGLEKIGEERWNAVVAISVGLVRARFRLDVIRPVMRKPDVMEMRVRGSAPGSSVYVVGQLNLFSEAAKQTRMDWSAQVTLGGLIARVGLRLLQSTVERMTAQFFACLKAHIQAAANQH